MLDHSEAYAYEEEHEKALKDKMVYAKKMIQDKLSTTLIDIMKG
jgi:hypothetical protein